MYWYYGYRAVIADLEENKVSLVFFVCIIYSGDEEFIVIPSPASENTGRFKSNPETKCNQSFLSCLAATIKNTFTNPKSLTFEMSTARKNKTKPLCFLTISQWILDLHNTGAATIMDFSVTTEERSMVCPGIE